MGIYFKFALLLYMILKIVYYSDTNYMIVLAVLILTALNIYREKYKNLKLLLIFECLIVFLVSQFYYPFTVLFSYLIFDFILIWDISFILLLFTLFIYSILKQPDLEIILTTSLMTLTSFHLKKLKDKEDMYKKSFDTERKLRLELEYTKAQLLNNMTKIRELAELKERDRIAKQLHDKLGHSIAGILFQLQASKKLLEKDSDRAGNLLEESINGLSNAFTLVRDTIHNMKSPKNIGIDEIMNIIENFKFCKVKTKFTGNFNRLNAEYFEILTSIIQESLTNTSRYSNATEVQIYIDIFEKFVRLYIKDNGAGCKNIKEGMGLSTAREIVKNTGGNISIDGNDGFMIVCILPLPNGGA